MKGNYPFSPSSPNREQSTVSFERPLQPVNVSGISPVLRHPLDHTEEFYNLIFSSITDVFLITDQTGVLLFISPNVELICGYSKSEVQEKFYTIIQLLGDNLIQNQNLEAWENLSIWHCYPKFSGGVHLFKPGSCQIVWLRKQYSVAREDMARTLFPR